MRKFVYTKSPFERTTCWYRMPQAADKKICEKLKEAMNRAFKPEQEYLPVVEFFQEGETLTVKVRGAWNQWFRKIEENALDPVVRYVTLMSRLRDILNMNGFKTAKVQCSIHNENHAYMNNIRIVYNPHWRRYENYEIFFRNNTQSSRRKFCVVH